MAVGTGEVIIDFGTGKDLVTITISRSSVDSVTTHVEAYLFPKATGSGLTDHKVDEHLIDPPSVYAHSIVTGVGFSITALSPPAGRSKVRGSDYLSGRYTIRWVSTE
jgi:hypothetical protein